MANRSSSGRGRRRGWRGASAALLAAMMAGVAAAGTGPDVIVGELPTVRYWGAAEGISAYSIATTSCNIGDAHLLWIEKSSQHPVIAQNIYRIKDGRLEQIGQSWLKHGFCALQQTACGPCDPAGVGCIDRLGVGCSDPYSANLNGNHARLGPRSHVDPFTAAFPYPYLTPPPDEGWLVPPAPHPIIGRRVQVPTVLIDPALNAGAVYMIEGQYVAADDAAAGNSLNNTSYRRVTVQNDADGNIAAVLAMDGPTQRQKPAIEGWKDADADVTLRIVDVPGEGRFYAAGKAIDNGDGTWTYNYAVYNMNSHIAAGSLGVGIPCGTTAGAAGFSAPHSHSGELYSNDPWSVQASATSMSWRTESFADNPNANALRWGTTYTFWVTADAPPAMGAMTLGLFSQSGSVAIIGMPVPGERCRVDLNGDGVFNSNDLRDFIATWLESRRMGTMEADFNCDGVVNSADLTSFISSWRAAAASGC